MFFLDNFAEICNFKFEISTNEAKVKKMNNLNTQKDFSSILKIERPSGSLLKLYLIRALMSGPALFIAFPVLFFRYYTMRYHFDEDGISMKWGLLFKKEVNLTYTRIQDIHVTSGVIQRWFRLADLKIQTASGNMEAEMTIEGIHEYELLRDFIYSHMKGYKAHFAEQKSFNAKLEKSDISVEEDKVIQLLNEIKNELSEIRHKIESRG